jgi:hypothetical protein
MVRVSANAQASCGLFTKANGFTSFAWDTMASWDSYVRNGELAGNRLWDVASTLWFNNGAVLLGTLSTFGLTNHNNYLYGNRPNTGGLKKYCRLFESAAFATGVARLRLYYGDAGTIIITSNAGWEQPSTVGAWIGDDATVDAFALAFNHGGLALWRRDKDVGDGTTLWFDAGEGIETWHSVMAWGGSASNTMLPYPAMGGASIDEVKIAHSTNYEDSGAPYYRGYAAVTWHSAMTGATASDVTYAVESCAPTTGNWTVTVVSADAVGAVLSFSAAIPTALVPHWYGTVTCTKP